MNLVAFAANNDQPSYAAMTIALAVTLPAALILLRAYRALAGTTLIIPWAWCCGVFALASFTCLDAALAPGSSRMSSFAAIHFVAACGTLCPLVALLGAKRPQHSAWSYVVLALWAMLALPAAEVIFLQPGQALEINAFRGWFLWILIAAELLNFGMTRYGMSSLLLVAGQIVWLRDYLPLLPLIPPILSGWSELLGLVLVSLAIVSAWGFSLRNSRNVNVSVYDRVWFDFRDSFGLFWALRLTERVNDGANQAGWDFDLGWTGFRTKQDFAPLGELAPEIEAPLRNNLQGLLRRFVSQQWISQRLGPPLDLPAMKDIP